MKVGILTFHRALNYGAVLQAYALQTVLDRLDIENEVIDYRCPHIEDAYRKRFVRGSVKRRLRQLLIYPTLKRKGQKFLSFLSSRMKLSAESPDSGTQLRTCAGRYAAVIVGSDQVWNRECTGFDPAYFLDFIDDAKKKISYAASFGVSALSAADAEACQKLLRGFGTLSVREPQGEAIIRGLLSRDACVNLDPTFLLSPETWMNIAKPPRRREEYVLVYPVYRSAAMFRFAAELARKNGLRLIILGDRLIAPVCADCVATAGPEEFLGYLINARYVVTNAFHGLAFSIVLHKEFFVELSDRSAAVNSRLENIVRLFSLHDREIGGGNSAGVGNPVDYARVDKIMERERKKSLYYLLHALEIPA